MIVFDLRCPGGHIFEGWFGSTADYEDQRRRGLLACPVCGEAQVDKAVMAPRLGHGGEAGADAGSVEEMKEMMGKLAALQKKVLAGSDYVGERFADEARAIHLGEVEARSIHGKATRAETEQLRDDGISVSPLPFPVVEPGEEN